MRRASLSRARCSPGSTRVSGRDAGVETALPLAAALLVFVDVMKELPATIVLRPFNTDTLAVVANQLARDERLGEAALPSLALVLVGLVPVIQLSRTLRVDRRPLPPTEAQV